ncbi:hypothetical protein Tco_0268761 [Tanacetum coccineum]
MEYGVRSFGILRSGSSSWMLCEVKEWIRRIWKYGNNWQVDDVIVDEILGDLLKIELEKQQCVKVFSIFVDDKRKVTRIKILDDLEQRIENHCMNALRSQALRDTCKPFDCSLLGAKKLSKIVDMGINVVVLGDKDNWGLSNYLQVEETCGLYMSGDVQVACVEGNAPLMRCRMLIRLKISDAIPNPVSRMPITGSRMMGCLWLMDVARESSTWRMARACCL